MKRFTRFCLLSLLVCATPSAFAHAVPMTLRTASAETFTAYVDGPKNASKGIVLVHDWFGVSPFYTAAAEKLASDGYRVVAVDLYGGRTSRPTRRPARSSTSSKPCATRSPGVSWTKRSNG